MLILILLLFIKIRSEIFAAFGASYESSRNIAMLSKKPNKPAFMCVNYVLSEFRPRISLSMLLYERTAKEKFSAFFGDGSRWHHFSEFMKLISGGPRVAKRLDGNYRDGSLN